jgi:transposase-like protein
MALTPATQLQTRKRLSRDERKAILALYVEKRTPQALLAKQFNVAQSTVSNIVNNKGLSPCEQRREQLENKILAYCATQPRTLRDLEDYLDLSVRTIIDRLSALPIYQFRKAGTSKPYFYTTDASHPLLLHNQSS